MAESARRVEGGAIPELPVRETGRENPIASAVSKPLKEVAELPVRMALTPEIGRRVSTQSKTGALERMKHASMRALGKLQPKEEEPQRAGSSLTRRVEEGGVAYEGETARVRDLNGTTMEFKKAGELGRGGESSAFDARVQGDGKVHQRAFV